MSGIGYITDFELFYTQYEVMLNTLNILEFIVLISWMPRDAIFAGCQRFCKRMGMAWIYSHTSHNRRVSHSHSHKGKD